MAEGHAAPAVQRALALLRHTIEKEMGAGAAQLHLPLAALELGLLGEAPSASAGPGCQKNVRKDSATLGGGGWLPCRACHKLYSIMMHSVTV